MGEKLLEIHGLRAGVEDREIIKDAELTLGRGETHVLLGPNGSGKTTLMNVLMGNPRYSVSQGTVRFDGEDLLPLPVWERARRGLFLSFQTPEEIPGVTVENMLRTARQAASGKKVGIMAFRKELSAALDTLKMDENWGSRPLNVGFSGGEKKRTEILQLLMMQPKLALLDETDSGLDVDAVHIVSEGIQKFRSRENACLIITYNAGILCALTVDKVHVMLEGRIVKSGGPALAEEIGKYGYGVFAAAEG